MQDQPKILIVDDERFYINVLVDLLREDYKLFVAKTGAQALERLQDNLPDVVLLDVQLPDKDGFEVCSHLKSHPQWRSAQVIFLTASDDPLTRETALGCGGFECLTKPVDAQQVKQSIVNAINMSQSLI